MDNSTGYAVAYRVKWASGVWDSSPRAVRVRNGNALDKLIKKISADDTLTLSEIRVYDPIMMNLPMWDEDNE